MSTGAKTIVPDMLAAAALRIMEENEISSLVVVDEKGNLAGVVHLKDLLHAGIV
jgi:arabinose-5-phosphate isomerase